MSVPAFLLTETLGAATSALNDYLTVIPKGRLGDGIEIYATLEETHHSVVELTEHPVENGASITDHSYSRPIEVVLKCGWSNSSPAALSQLVTGAASSLINSGGSSLFADGSGPNADYVSGIYSQVVNLQQQRQPITIVTTLKSYPNMIITAVQVTRDKTNSQALMMSVTCRQVILVSTDSTTLAPVANQANPATTAQTFPLGRQTLFSGVTPAPGGVVSPSQWVQVQ